jgi:UDP:flavonoid glycosyltransferase YjiC (YdhE family)
MPADLKILRRERLVNISVRGTFNDADLDQFLRELVQGHALAFGKIVDLRGAAIGLSASALIQHAGKLAAYASQGDVGPLALVVDATTRIDASVLASLAAAERPCRIFEDTIEAVDWLRTCRMPSVVVR